MGLVKNSVSISVVVIVIIFSLIIIPYFLRHVKFEEVETLKYNFDFKEMHTIPSLPVSDFEDGILKLPFKRQIDVVPANQKTVENFKEKFLSLPNSPKIEWIQEAVRFFNVLRELHGSKNLELDFELAYEAQLWANELGKKSYEAGKPILQNSLNVKNHQYGESLGFRQDRIGSRQDLMSLPGSFPVRNWYKEITHYNWKTNYFQWNTTNFIQLIWGSTKKVGCGKMVTPKDCKKRPILMIVCLYSPQGNWLHKSAFKEHVHVPKKGNGNDLPDFGKFCPNDTNRCSRPMLCCPKNYKTNYKLDKDICIGTTTERISGNVDFSSTSPATPKLHKGRSFQQSIKTTTVAPIITTTIKQMHTTTTTTTTTVESTTIKTIQKHTTPEPTTSTTTTTTKKPQPLPPKPRKSSPSLKGKNVREKKR